MQKQFFSLFFNDVFDNVDFIMLQKNQFFYEIKKKIKIFMKQFYTLLVNQEILILLSILFH